MRDPCEECIVITMCIEYCENKIKYYSALLKEYMKYGKDSVLFKNAPDYVKRKIHDINSVVIRTNYAYFKMDIDSKETYKALADGDIKLHTRTKYFETYLTFPSKCIIGEK